MQNSTKLMVVLCSGKFDFLGYFFNYPINSFHIELTI